MTDISKIARLYAEKHGCDILQPCGKRNDNEYFYLNKSSLPRYTGIPYIIKISPEGRIQRETNLSEVAWAYSNRVTANEQSV